jgi:5-formyltetrahydrofolate cyclo-ligase
MGGGFYDRSLAYLSNRQYNKKPYLIGLAHELQKTDQLPVNSWDIRMDVIATEEKIYNNRPGA